MECAHTNTRTINSRKHGDNNIANPRHIICLRLRQRECVSCGHRIITYEMTGDQLNAMSNNAHIRQERLEARLRDILAATIREAV